MNSLVVDSAVHSTYSRADTRRESIRHASQSRNTDSKRRFDGLDTYTVDLLNPQIFGKNDLYIDYCLFLNPFYVFLFVIIFVESHLTSDCF